MLSVQEQDAVLHRREYPIPNLTGLDGDICASFEDSYRATVIIEKVFQVPSPRTPSRP